MADCSVDGCSDPTSGLGMCGKHYMRWKRHGETFSDQDTLRRGKPRLTLEEFTEHFWERVDPSAGPDACWPWMGGHMTVPNTDVGYGIVNARGILKHPEPTHRVAFWLTHGRWPKGHTRHTCDNHPCNNPKHLLEGSAKANAHDSMERGRWKIGGRTTGTWAKGDTYINRMSPTDQTEPCPICGTPFVKKRRIQKTCGKPHCGYRLRMQNKQDI